MRILLTLRILMADLRLLMNLLSLQVKVLTSSLSRRLWPVTIRFLLTRWNPSATLYLQIFIRGEIGECAIDAVTDSTRIFKWTDEEEVLLEGGSNGFSRVSASTGQGKFRSIG